MARMIRSKYGYEPTEWIQADARLDKWYMDKKRRASKQSNSRLKNRSKPVYQATQGDEFNSENKN
mgnify:CR=1 FL=1